MSALTSRIAALTRCLATTTATSNLTRAAFTTATRYQKSAVESAKDTLKTVDRKVADKLVDGIDIGTAYASKVKEAATQTTEGKASAVASKIKEATSEVSAGKVTGKAAELRGEVQGKASEVAGEAKGKASELAGEAKGKTSEMMGEAKGMAGEAKGKAKEVKGTVEEKMS
ncbi:hypothetical protein N657DRAFT_682494 [Parathielavia appendiculata]|uniref:LEA domain protein n=1 Tax=Parathielavia appendiculata TaxID=2587402 RepID=A0AAN6TWP2_9PEZI|nr:hypothetical protein N657DRAFT_682494 [Parathielavia appendiculata]